MAIKLNDKYVSKFVNQNEIELMQPAVTLADQLLRSKSGAGSDFLGWVTLPDDYDKEEFARIEACAKKIQSTSDILVVIGIGGSYLGARAVIEYIKSANYNNLKKDTPDIYFAGNSISADEISELLEGQHWDVIADFIAFTPEQVQRDIRLFEGKTSQYFFISSASAYQKPLSSPWITEGTLLHNPFWEYSRNIS